MPLHALSGDMPKARTRTRTFFALWKDADPDIPILKEAKTEYAKVRGPGPELIQSRAISVYCWMSCSNVLLTSVVPHVPRGVFQILTTVIPGLCESLSSRNLWAASREQRFVKNVLAYQREHPHPEFLQELVLLREKRQNDRHLRSW